MDIRGATPDDCIGIGGVHVEAWRTAYTGQFPDSYLNELDATERAEYWSVVLERTEAFGSRLIVAENESIVIGFACFGPAIGETDRGELYAMNVHPGHWRRGVGSTLLSSVSAQLGAMNLGDALLWTGEQNAPAQELYLANGWQLDGARREEEVHSMPIAEVRLAKVVG